jgi:hypothetical protein
MALQPAIPIDRNYCRVTVFIKTPTKVTSESHWLVEPNSATEFGEGIQKFDTETLATWMADLQPLRRQCFAKDCYTLAVRASSENLYKDSAVYTGDPGQTKSGPVFPENAGNDVLNIRMQCGDNYRRIMYLGAVPDVAMTDDKYKSDGDAQVFDTALAEYLVKLAGKSINPQETPVASKWGFLVLNKNAAKCPRVKITGITYVKGPPPILTVFCDKAHKLNIGDIVRVSRVPKVSKDFPLNQLWRALPGSDEKNFVIADFATASTDAIGNWFGGFAMRQEKTIAPYTGWSIETNVGTRKRGGRTFLPLGRVKRKITVGY